MLIRMLSHAINVKQNGHSKNAFSCRYTLFLLIVIRSKTIMRNISKRAKEHSIIPFLKNHVALPVFMKCGSGQHKLKVCGTKERYIIRNGIIFHTFDQDNMPIDFMGLLLEGL